MVQTDAFCMCSMSGTVVNLHDHALSVRTIPKYLTILEFQIACQAVENGHPYMWAWMRHVCMSIFYAYEPQKKLSKWSPPPALGNRSAVQT